MKVKIGLETHVQLNTKSKIFCGCANPAASGMGALQEKGAWVRDYLKHKNVRFEFVEHEPVTRPVNSANARGVQVKQIAKALVYVCDNTPVLFILSGDRKLDNEKAMAATGCKRIEMATPEEVSKYTGCVVGLVPPVIEGIKKVIDTRLLENDILSFNAGISTAGIKINRKELLKVLDNVKTAEISSDDIIVEKPGKEKHKPLLSTEAEPNTLTCPVCLGLPGSKPMANRRVVKYAMRVALALDSKIAGETFFSRKTYFYPDMSKNFQISQYEVPLALGGGLKIGNKEIRLIRIHMEEDPARLVHIGGLGGKHVLVDYNRAGIPLIEIVTEPDFESPEEARDYLNKLATILEYLGVYDSASRAVFKSDANISLEGGARIEVKNITGTREIEQALKYEILRQGNLLKRGVKAVRETRMWNPAMGATQPMRGKEEEEEYGYIFEPDLTRIVTGSKEIEDIRKSLPELPGQRFRRFVKQYGLPEKVAESIVSELDLAELFEQVAKGTDPRLAGTWISGYLKKTLNWHGLRFRESGLRREWILSLLRMFRAGKITDRNAEMAIRKMVEEKRDPEDIVRKYKLGKSELDLDSIIKKVLEREKQAVSDYKQGEEKALHFLVGQVMRETRGRADAGEIRKAVLKSLK